MTLNTAGETTGGGGIFINTNASITNFVSTIVADNSDGGSADSEDIQSLGTIGASSFNLIGVNTVHTIVNAVNNNQVGTAGAPLSPGLGPLQNNGGITRTHDLLVGSLAIDTGSDPGTAFDQRGVGFPRVL